jgi:Integral peroxisomal membrane peroxin
MFVYSFICLDPCLLVVLPAATLLFFIMIPAFLARHPPPPSTSTSGTAPYSYQGPALAPPKTISPASETSKDFFHNMRDLQNTMADYSNLHDAAVSFLAPPTNFSDENLSSTLFLALSAVIASLLLISHLLPWRWILFVGGNTLVIVGHPDVQGLFQHVRRQLSKAESTQPDIPATNAPRPAGPRWLSLLPSPSSLMSFLRSIADISLDSYPEEREVEIFELQYRSLAPYSTSSGWETLLFSPTPYDPLSPLRIAGDRPRGCRFFEDVQPPSGWAWKGKKWQLDLDCREWVLERMITGVGFEVPDHPGGNGISEEMGGWVWDLASEAPDEDEEFSLVASNEPSELSKMESDYKGKGKGKAPDSVNIMSLSWEYTTSSVSSMGEWRRRRWTRVVHRVSVPAVERDKDNDTDRD